MLVPKDDGTYQCGPLDIACILHDVTTDRYHAAFFEEHPFPGPVPPVNEVKVVRLRSKMHHTAGAETLEESKEHMAEMVKQLGVPEQNVWAEPQEWNGELGLVWVVPNWLANTP